MNTFTIEGFARGCEAAVEAAENRREAAKEYLAAAMQTHGHEEMIQALEAAVPAGSGIGEMIVYRSPTMTLLYARIPPRFRSGVHNHTVCACIGQLKGEERSVLYERDEDGTVRPTETLSTREGEVIALTRDVIHHIENPTDGVSSSLHIYAGDFGAIADRRSLWSAEDGREGPFSFERLVGESVRAMKKDGNDAGLDAVAEAIPATKALIATL